MVVARRFVLAALLLAPGVAAAQIMSSPRPGGGAPALPPHIQAQLWPERELSPVELELKNHVIVINDSLTRINATGAQVERQVRAGASPAIIGSTARNLASQCAAAGRTAGPVSEFAATLSTSDSVRGEPAVRAWRSGLTALRRELGTCETDASAVVVAARDGNAGERLAAVATRVGQALSEYRRTEQALIRTLKIEISPLKKSR